MGKVGVGVIGCGGAASIGHLPWYQANPDVKIVAVADVEEERAKSFRDGFGAETYFSDYNKLLARDDIEAVSICTPPWLHCEQCVKAAEAGKHVLVEKPMARTVKECDEMIEACRRNRVKLMVGFMKRFNPAFQLVKKYVDDGTVGKAFYLDAHWEMYVPPGSREWRLFDPRVGGGIFQDHGSHYIDLFRWWASSEVDSVFGETLKLVEDRAWEDHVVALLRFRNGALGVIETSKDTRVGKMMEYGWVHGANASLHFDAPPWDSKELPKLWLYGLGGDSCPIGGQHTVELHADHAGHSTYMFKREIDHFIQCIMKDEKPLASGEDGRAAIEVVTAVYGSSRLQKKVKIPLK